MKTKRLVSNKIIIALIALVLIGGAGYWFLQRNNTTRDENGINYGPPTETEKKEADDNKDRVAERTKIEEEAKEAANNPNTSPSLKTVTPLITRAAENDDQIEVIGYVPGIFEEGGTCTAVLNNGGAEVTATSSGFGNVSTTGCAPIRIPLSQFSGQGEWSVVLKYSSSTAQGSSAKGTVKVP